MPIAAVNNAITYIPLAEAGFAWIVPGVAGALIGMALAKSGVGSPIPAVVELGDESDGVTEAA
jgi:hypothetical protein